MLFQGESWFLPVEEVWLTEHLGCGCELHTGSMGSFFFFFNFHANPSLFCTLLILLILLLLLFIVSSQWFFPLICSYLKQRFFAFHVSSWGRKGKWHLVLAGVLKWRTPFLNRATQAIGIQIFKEGKKGKGQYSIRKKVFSRMQLENYCIANIHHILQVYECLVEQMNKLIVGLCWFWLG